MKFFNVFVFACFVLIVFILIIVLIIVDIPRIIRLHFLSTESFLNLDLQYSQKERVNLTDRTIVSMTTIPERIDNLKVALSSLLTNTQRVDEIIINIPYLSRKGKEYNIPLWLSSCKSIKIIRCDYDYGSSTKLLPTLQRENPNTNIIVVDDDILYGVKTIQWLAETFMKRNCKEVVTTVSIWSDNNKLKQFTDFILGEGPCKKVFGYMGYILKPSMISDRVFDYTVAPKEAVLVDDDWITGWILYTKTPIYMVGLKFGNSPYFTLNNLDTPMLKINNSDGSNAKIVQNFFENVVEKEKGKKQEKMVNIIES
jgi:hypothetical protein